VIPFCSFEVSIDICIFMGWPPLSQGFKLGVEVWKALNIELRCTFGIISLEFEKQHDSTWGLVGVLEPLCDFLGEKLDLSCSASE
jgi:hypothetical protein